MYRSLFGIVLFLKFIYTENVENKGMSYSETEYSTIGETKTGINYFTDVPYFTLTHPKRIVVMMNSDLVITLNYTVLCNSREDSYLVHAISGNPELFTLVGKKSFKVNCTDAEFMNVDFKDNISANQDLGQNATNGTNILAVQSSLNVKLYGVLLGIGTLNVRSTSDVKDNNDTNIKENIYMVNILRVRRPVDNAFQVIVACFISIVIIGFGCSLDLEVVKQCLKKPAAPGLGLASQYILMPLIGFTVASLVPIENRAISFGIFVSGVCPGGGSSNIYSYLLGGDINLSITMTCISTVAALGLMPLWIYTLGRRFVDEEFNVVIPYVNMLQTLAMITIPLFIGLFVKYKFPKAARKFLKILKPATIIMMIIFMSVGIYSNFYIFKLIKPEYLVAGGLLPYTGYLAGAIVAFIFRQPWTRIKTIALETGMQNTKVAYFIMVTSFPPPQGDIAAMAPIALAITTPIPPLLITIPYLLYKRWTKSYEIVTVDTDEETNNDESKSAKFSDDSENLTSDSGANSTGENN